MTKLLGALERVVIDGSYGEGGGQILRTSIMMAAILGYEVEVYNVRAKRSNPGLRPQHVAAVRALAEITGGSAEGLRVGSSRVVFRPGKELRRSSEIDVGTAGSITLILQAVVPALSLLGSDARLRVRGGTDTRWSPTSSYFGLVVGPAFQALGIGFSLRVARRGYYPRGGGLVDVGVRAARGLRAFSCAGKPGYKPVILSVYSRLPSHVGDRQASSAARALRELGLQPVRVEIREEPAAGPGTSVVVYSVSSENPHFVGGDAVGERGVPAERIGGAAAERFLGEVKALSCVDKHLSDMLIPILALASGASRYRTSELTGHMKTSAYVAMRFVPGSVVSFRRAEPGVEVEVKGGGLIR